MTLCVPSAGTSSYSARAWASVPETVPGMHNIVANYMPLASNHPTETMVSTERICSFYEKKGKQLNARIVENMKISCWTCASDHSCPLEPLQSFVLIVQKAMIGKQSLKYVPLCSRSHCSQSFQTFHVVIVDTSWLRMQLTNKLRVDL